VTLPEVLRDVIRRVKVGAIVTLARSGEKSYQMRFMPDSTIARGYRVSGRHWIVETRPGSEFEGWSHWSNFLGFSIDGAIADDWKIAIVEER
jgi:hypothetical protein